MTQLSSKVLQKVAEELNDFLDITPRISTKSTDEVLREKILEAAGLLVVDGKVNEMLELSKTTQKVISELQTYVDTEEEEEEPPLEFDEATPPSEAGIIMAMDLEELKAHIKANKEVFVTASKGINLMKDLEKIREKALKDVGFVEPVEEEKPTEKKPESKKPAKKIVKETSGRFSMEGLATALLQDSADEKTIKKAFTEAYARKGRTDKEFVEKRIRIYMSIAKKNADE